MCDAAMTFFTGHHLPSFALRHSLTVVFSVVLFSLNPVRGDTPTEPPGETEINDEQRSVNDLLGAPLINNPDSSIATENTKFSEETAYSKQQNEKARLKSKDLGATQNTEDAKAVIREVLGLDASPSVKTDFRKASLLQLASHSEQKKAYEEAQKYLSQYLQRYSDDALIPVVLLRQGDLFRKMGAYDLERQKYYDVIKSAPKVKLSGRFDLNYVKRIAFIARSQIADSFYEEAGKLPRHRAKDKYVSASEMYARLTEAEEADKRVITLKYVRSLYNQGNHDGVVKVGGSYFQKFENGPERDEDEVRYLVLDSSRRESTRAQDYLAGYRDWFESPPGHGSDGVALKWRLKASRDLAGELFNEGNYADSLEFYRTLADLLSGTVTRPEEYLYLMLSIKRVLSRAEALEAGDTPGPEISNLIEPMLLDVQGRAKSSLVRIPLINAVLNDSGNGSFKGGSSGAAEWSSIKPALVKSLDVLAVECEKAYTFILPILYRIALCSEKIPAQSALGKYEKIRVGVMDVEANPGVVDNNAVFSNEEVKFHILKKPVAGNDSQGVLICVWHGIPASGMELKSEDGGGGVKIVDFVGLANLASGINLHEKSLPLKLVSDMASWRISTLKWEESFKKQVTEIAN